MKVARMVQKKWMRFRKQRRRAIRSMAKGHSDANTRRRAQIIVALVQDKAVRTIADILQCSKSLVYKVAHRFLRLGEVALADRREENGIRVVSETVEKLIWIMVAQTP